MAITAYSVSGVDELLVLCAQIDQDTLAERIRQLECLTAEKDVNIAVGVTWQDRDGHTSG